jgi:hypothetical protein
MVIEGYQEDISDTRSELLTSPVTAAQESCRWLLGVARPSAILVQEADGCLYAADKDIRMPAG